MVSDDDHVFPSLEIREQVHTLTVTQKLQVPKPKDSSLNMYVLYLHCHFSLKC